MRRVWAARKAASRASLRPGSSSENTSSSSSTGGLPAAAGDHLVGGQPQGQGQRPLLALGGVGPSRQAGDGQVDVVAVRADQADAAAELVAAGRDERAARPASSQSER